MTDREITELLHKIRIGRLPDILGRQINQIPAKIGQAELARILQKNWDREKGLEYSEFGKFVRFNGRHLHVSVTLYPPNDERVIWLMSFQFSPGHYLHVSPIRYKDRVISRNSYEYKALQATIERFVNKQLKTKVNYENYYEMLRIYGQARS